MMRLLALVAGVLLNIMPVSAKSPDLADAWNGAEINWRDIKSGIYEASTSGKTAIMVFHAPWCSACKRYREVFKDAGVVAASKKFVMILVDADADKMTNGAFSPDGTYVPRTLFMNSQGDVLTRFVGKDPKYPHTIDVDDPNELRKLMLNASSAAAPDGMAVEHSTKTSTGARLD
ncbi:MAG: thioredoxin family protein [Hyphomicrobium sp.]|nr:thioredoxin family protein [Hyphomicrobium sp.]